MLKINPYIHDKISSRVLADNEEREPSGRLSAGKLGYPLQWQMLHYFKVPTNKPDEYTLRKFMRGRDTEARIVDLLDVPQDKRQVECNYRDVIGYCDMVLEYPVEVKSVTNLAYKYIQKEGVKRGHRLQAELYAKALGYDTFAVCYVASDDYRTLCFEEKITDGVDKVIDRYEAQVKSGKVPVFEPEEKWQSNKEYNMYSDWMGLTQEEIDKKLETITSIIK